MAGVFCVVDDKHVPIYRVLWVSDVPHFCGEGDCAREGEYEVRLDGDESVWVSRGDRDRMLDAVEEWTKGPFGEGYDD